MHDPDKWGNKSERLAESVLSNQSQTHGMLLVFFCFCCFCFVSILSDLIWMYSSSFGRKFLPKCKNMKCFANKPKSPQLLLLHFCALLACLPETPPQVMLSLPQHLSNQSKSSSEFWCVWQYCSPFFGLCVAMGLNRVLTFGGTTRHIHQINVTLGQQCVTQMQGRRKEWTVIIN